ncbi:MAG: TIGR03619 family F420-dependent LLM class oxidoreductase [Candidatus Limnocylindrales bacterium]
MEYGLCLPNVRDTSTNEGLEAAAETAERLGWTTIWTTDHLLINQAAAFDYGRTYEAIVTLAWLGARHQRVRLGTSVIVAPMRNAVVLAKEWATLDAMSGGRVVAGLGAGWNRVEFANVGTEDRFDVRGGYLAETIRLCRHLWSGSTEPFHGRFHQYDDFVFGPLPAQGDKLPIIVGGRSEPALRRVGRMADGYQSSAAGPATYAERVAVIRAAAEGAERPMPWLTARVNVQFDGVSDDAYALRGTPDEMAAEVRAFAATGVSHLALWFDSADAEELVQRVERFDREVAPLV